MLIATRTTWISEVTIVFIARHGPLRAGGAGKDAGATLMIAPRRGKNPLARAAEPQLSRKARRARRAEPPGSALPVESVQQRGGLLVELPGKAKRRIRQLLGHARIGQNQWRGAAGPLREYRLAAAQREAVDAIYQRGLEECFIWDGRIPEPVDEIRILLEEIHQPLRGVPGKRPPLRSLGVLVLAQEGS